jgi:hypothetical protein
MKIIKLTEKYGVSVGLGYTFGEMKLVHKKDAKTKVVTSELGLINTTYPHSWETILSTLMDRLIKDQFDFGSSELINLEKYLDMVAFARNEVLKVGKYVDKVLKQFDD